MLFSINILEFAIISENLTGVYCKEKPRKSRNNEKSCPRNSMEINQIEHKVKILWNTNIKGLRGPCSFADIIN